MIIFPAIDIQSGTCVRLFKGDFSTAHKVAENPLDTALSFQSAGAEWIHMVDLDGAKTGMPANSEIFIEIAKNSGLKVELGGGIRTLKTIEYYLKNGISRVILGSAALKNPELVKAAVENFSDKIAVGIDAVNGMAAAEGWLDVSSVYYIDMAKCMADAGVKYIIFTDISRDGMLSGPNFQQLAELSKSVPVNITASGGISCIEDIVKLKSLSIYGAICGKSIYSGSLNLAEAVKLSK